jgi:hypothetical protein
VSHWRRAHSGTARQHPRRAQTVDTLAAEWPAETNYLYSSYHAQVTDTAPSWRKKVMVLGSGDDCIGFERGVRLVLRQRSEGGAS